MISRAALVVIGLAPRVATELMAHHALAIDPRLGNSESTGEAPADVRNAIDSRLAGEHSADSPGAQRCDGTSTVVAHVPGTDQGRPDVWVGVACRGGASSPYTPPLWRYAIVVVGTNRRPVSFALTGFMVDPIAASEDRNGVLRVALYSDDHPENFDTIVRSVVVFELRGDRVAKVGESRVLEQCCWGVVPCAADKATLGVLDMSSRRPRVVGRSRLRRACNERASWTTVLEPSPSGNK